MKSLFFTPIRVVFSVTCYHYEWRTTGSGKNRRTKREKIVTFTGEQDFAYYSWKDISGPFLVDSSTAMVDESIIFVKLKLACDYLPHDQYTTTDLNIQRNNYFSSNRHRDQYMDTATNVVLPGMKEFNLVKVSDKEVPCFFGIWWFVFFTFIIPVAQIYKYYINSVCSFQYFVIKKEISTRVNLNLPEFSGRFESEAPKILLNRQTTNFYQDNTGLLHDNPDLPNEKDLEIGEHNKVWVDNNNFDENFESVNVNTNNSYTNINSNNNNNAFISVNVNSNKEFQVPFNNFSNNNYSNLTNSGNSDNQNNKVKENELSEKILPKYD
jgi:hypothetical protein